MAIFESQYKQSVQLYYQTLEQQHRKDNATQQEWQQNEALRKDFAESQHRFIHEMQSEEERKLKENIEQIQGHQLVQEYQEQFKNFTPSSQADAKTVRSFSWVYPASTTAAGAPISAGATLASKRKSGKEKRRRACC
eukprot:GHVU01041291.1.p2 GENE.GHVU01041291.1~~GHVU01041291.1.p2  ORF type:complete len:137 (-),score=23.81 GHVU01041291.1:1293-1703(-)